MSYVCICPNCVNCLPHVSLIPVCSLLFKSSGLRSWWEAPVYMGGACGLGSLLSGHQSGLVQSSVSGCSDSRGHNSKFSCLEGLSWATHTHSLLPEIPVSCLLALSTFFFFFLFFFFLVFLSLTL